VGSNFLHLAAQVLGAGDALPGMLRQNEFKDVSSKLLELWGVGSYYHAFGYRCGARGGKTWQIFNLYDAQATSSVWAETGMITQSWNVDAFLSSCL